MKLNTDGSLGGSWAAVIRNDEGTPLAAAKGRKLYNSIDLIELQGVLNGVQMAIRHGWTEVEASTDLTCVVYYYTMKNPKIKGGGIKAAVLFIETRLSGNELTGGQVSIIDCTRCVYRIRC